MPDAAHPLQGNGFTTEVSGNENAARRADPLATKGRRNMIILGVILILIGIFAKISILTTIGVILAVIGVVLWILGATGRAVGGRSHYW